MADKSSKQLIEDIRVRNDIADTIGRYVPLKKVGGGRFVALCPFHKEKTPSFHVNPMKQIYHCFGCGKGGDVFTFLMDIENVTFPEAARMLAERAGLAYEFNREEKPRDGIDKQSLFKLHEDLAAFYFDTLENSPDAEHARAYIKERDLDQARKDFQLGLAPPGPNAVLNWAKTQHIDLKLLEKAGVLLPNESGRGYYDRFRGRLMFPIRDEQGRVAAFSGRILDQSSPAKYVNSPETMLFTKGRILYGLDRARQSMVEQRRAVVCEGQIDVIRSHLAGAHTAVAPQGTALTEMHASLLKRYADEVVLVFDADIAGQNATLRAAETLLQAGLSVKVASPPAGEDPDSLIRKQGAQHFLNLIEKGLSLVEFQVTLLKEREDLSSEPGLMRASRSLLETIQHAPSAVQREQYIREAALLLNISEGALTQDMRHMHRPTRPQSSADSAPPADRPQHAPHEIALVELLLAHPEVTDLVSQYLPPDSITDPDCHTIIRTLIEHPEPVEANLLVELADAGDECKRLAAQIQMNARAITSSDEEINSEFAARDLILNLWRKRIDRKRAECRHKMDECEGQDLSVLINESAQLTFLRKKLDDGWDVAVPILEMELE